MTKNARVHKMRDECPLDGRRCWVATVDWARFEGEAHFPAFAPALRFATTGRALGLRESLM